MKNQFKRIGAFILNGFAVNLDRFNQRVQQLLLSTENEFASALIPPCQTPVSVSSVTDSAPVLIWVADTHGKCTYFNQTWLNFTGRSLDQELGDGWTDGVHPDELQRYRDTFLTAFHARRPFSMEYRLRQANGEYRWVLNNGMPQFQNNQEFAGYIGTCVDITHLKQAESQVLAHLEEANLWRSRYEAAGRANNQVLYDYDFSYQRMAWEGDVESLLSYTAAELNSQGLPFWLSLVYPDDRAQLQAAIQAIVTLKQPIQQLEYRLRRKDGSSIWVQDSNEILLDEAGNTSRVIGFITDITPRKQAETALRQSQARLAEAQRVAHLGNWEFNLQSQKILWSEELFRMFGRDPRHSEPSYADYLQFYIHPDDHAELRQCVERAIATGQDYTLTYRAMLPDGTIRYHEGRGNVEYDAQGQVMRLFGTAQDITTAKLAEQKLKDSEAFLDSIINAITDPIFVKDEQHRWVSGNAAFCDLVGASNAEFAGKTDYDFFPPEQAQVFWEHDEEVLTTGLENFNEEVENHARLGFRTVATKKTRFQDSAGNRFIVGYSRDVTEQKHAEAEIRQSQHQLAAIAAKIRQSEEQLRLTLEFTGIGAWSWHPVTGEYSWDGKMEALLELPLGMDNMFQVWRDRIHPDDREKVTASLQQALATQASFSEEYRYFLQNGQTVWRWVVGQGIYSETGDVVRVLGVVQDIDDRKRIEVALRQSEAQYRRIVETANEGIWIIDSDNRTSFVNPKMATMLGYTLDEMLGKSMFEFMEEADVAIAQQNMERRQQGITEQHDFKFQHQDGTDVWVLISSSPIMDEAGQYIGALGMITDISDRKRAEFALQEKQQQLNSLLNNIPHIAWLKDRDGCFLAVNEPFAQACGVPLSQLAGLTDLDIWPQHLAEAYMQDDREVMASGQQKRVEEPLFTPEGIEKWIETIKTPILNDQGESIGTAGIAMDITERRRTELALQQLNGELERRVQQRTQELARSEQDLRTIFNNVYDAIVIHDMDGNILDCNDRSLELFAATRAQLLAANVATLAAEATQFEMFPATMQRVEAGETPRFEWRARRFSDAAVLEVEVSLRKVTLANRPVTIAGVRDISDRKQAEQQLQAERLRLQLALEAADMGTWESNLETGIWSERTEAIFGYAPGTFPGDREAFLRLVHVADQERVFAALAHSFSTRSPYRVEYRINHLDGLQRWVAVNGTVVDNEDGSGRRIVGVALDITERKQAEQALRESEERFRQLAENVGEVFWLTDLQSKMLYLSPAFQTVWGRPTHFLFDPATNILDTIHPDDRDCVKRCMANKSQETYDIEYRIFRPDGEERWIRDRAFLIHNEAGEVYRIGGIAEDISDRKRAEQALQQLNLELEQRVSDRTLELQQAMEAAEAANQAKSTFLANMSHELRTPLNAILGFAQLMSRDLTLDSQKREQLSIINRSGKHLLSLINDILEMSKIEAGCTVFAPNQFDLYTQIDMLEGMFQLRATEKGLQFIIERDPSLPRYIETDENKLRQVLINLLGNAIKFTQRGYVRFRIRTQEVSTSSSPPLQYPTPVSSPTSQILHFEVEDTGVGIDACEIDSLFEPFIQSRNRQLSQEGTGLGLPISRQFVQLMGGELTVQTTLGIGSTFTFTIPVNRVEIVDVHTSVARPILGLAPTQPPFRILVVEDNDTNRRLLVQLLQSVGFEVRFARDGQQAIAEWETWHPQLIWMDIRMPVMDGYKATRKIRALEQLSLAPPTIIIALTANAFEEERIRVLQVGCDDFMRKPFQDTELLEKMATHLGVQYLYADLDQWSVENTAPAEFDAIAALQMLPPALLTQLYQATLELDEQRLAALLEQISPEHADLIALLLKKLENFDLEDIFQLLQRVSQSE